MQPGGMRIEGGRRVWHVIGLIVSVVVALFLALITLGAVLGATGSASARAKSGDTFSGDVIGAIICAVLLVLAVLAAVHFEHELRRHQPAARSYRGGDFPPAGAPLSWSGRAGRRFRRRRYSPVVMTIEMLLFTGLAIGLIIGSFVVHGEADRSSYVQHHGDLRVAIVNRVDNIYTSSRSGGYYTADVYVSFSPAVDGHTTTDVHFPGRVDAPDGTAYTVLVDPQDPSYAEFPGSPSTTTSSWIVELVFGLILAVVDGLLISAWLRMLRHRRAMATQT